MHQAKQWKIDLQNRMISTAEFLATLKLISKYIPVTQSPVAESET